MKKYKVVPAFDEDYEPIEVHESPIDLVNVDDESERYFASDEDFSVGEIVSEDNIYFEDHPYVDDYGVHTAPFAFKKK